MIAMYSRFRSNPYGRTSYPVLSKGASALALMLCLAGGSRAQRDDRPPYTQENNSPSAARTSSAVPETLAVPAGTILRVSVNDYLSSDHNRPGDAFTATLEQPLVVRGWVVARRGETLRGIVQAAEKAGRVKGVSQLGVELTDLQIVDGQFVPIHTRLWRESAGTSHGQDAATIGTTTALGAAIGAAANGGTGAAIGAGSGAAAGIAAVLLTRGHPTVISPEAPLTFELVNPVEIDTTQSEQAFLPVTQSDYDRGRSYQRTPPVVVRSYPYSYPYPCAYGCGWPYGGPWPYWGPGFVAFYHYGYGGGFRHYGYWGHRRW